MMTGLGLVVAALGIGLVYSAVNDQSPTETLKELIRNSRPESRGTVTSELDTEELNGSLTGSFGQGSRTG